MPASPARRLVGRLALVAASLVVACGLAEVGARWLAPLAAEDLLAGSSEGATPGLYQSDPLLLTVPVPGHRSTWVSAGGAVALRVSDGGWRGGEPVPGRPVWLAVGDSFTMAVQVPEADSFVHLLGERRGLSILNAGVDGYSTWQSLFRYLELDARVQAQGALYTLFLGNDLTDNQSWLGLARQQWEPGVRLAPVRPQGGGEVWGEARPPTLWTRLAARSVLVGAWRVSARRRLVEEGRDPNVRRFQQELWPFTVEGRPDRENLLRVMEGALTQLRDDLHQRGDSLFVAVAPASFQLDPLRAQQTLDAIGLGDRQLELDAPRQGVLMLLDRLDIAHCDLQPALQASIAGGGSPYLRFDGHWSAAGHRVVAQALDACMGAP